MFGHQNGFGKVQAFSGVPGVIGTPPGVNGPSWALVERGGGGQVEARAPLAQTELD